MVRRSWVVSVQEVLEGKVGVWPFVKLERFVVADDGLFSECRHDKLEERKWLPLEQIRFFNTDCLVLSVLYDAVESVVNGEVLLLEDGDLRVEDLHELGLLLLQEEDLWVLRQLECIDETRVFHEASSVESLYFESGSKASAFLSHFLPVTIHVTEYDAGVVPALDFFGGEEQVFISRVGQ